MESYGSVYNDEERALKGLLDAFGSTFSLDDIASAYCKAGRNVDKAGEFLSEMQQGSGSSLSSTNNPVDGEARGSEQSSESSCAINDVSEQSLEGNGNSGRIVPRSRPVSVGSVSSIIGKGYTPTRRPANGSCNATKPMKLDSKVLPVSELWGEESESNSVRDDPIHRDMEEFLYSMLGDGFKLERNVIREVLDACGYNMPKTMEKLLDLSTATLDKKNSFVGDSTDKIDLCSKAEAPSRQRKCTNYSGGNEDTTSNSRLEVCAKQKQRSDLGREILTALFDAPQRENELPKKKVPIVKRSRTFGNPVVEPLFDSIEVKKTTAVQQQQQNEYDEEEESYNAVRKAVKEYRALVKEYYQSAVEAFVKGDRARARKLLEKGKFFHQKAHEADEESTEMIFGNSDVEAQDVMTLKLHSHGVREAIQLLKSHISSISHIPSFKYLKVILETNGDDKSKVSRRRREQVEKLLEKESIKWVEDENVGTILIRLDSINRKRLSFVK